MIDWDRVRELRDEVGAEDFQEVVQIFLEELDEALVRLRDAPAHGIEEGDLHFLKGCALNLGFDDVTRLCREGECVLRSGPLPPEKAAEITAAGERSKEAFVAGCRFCGMAA